MNKILLVDDEPGLVKVLAISLKDSGYQVQSAADGTAALKLFAAEEPEIVLTDIKMPGMDGIQLLKAIKNRNPDTEVIMMTGHGDLDLAIESLKFEATDYITKPIREDVLAVALKRASERLDLRRQLRQYTENLEQLVQEKSQKLIDAERMAAVGQTVADLAHAIKNIAGGLKGGAFVVEKGLELDHREYLEQGWELVKGNVQKIADLAMDLLNYASAAELRRVPEDPNLPARVVFKLMQSQAEGQRIHLSLNLDKSLAPVTLDSAAIQRCLLNLVANALDACQPREPGTDADGEQDGAGHFPAPQGSASNTDSQPPAITIETAAIPDWAVEYRVKDNGPGMSQEVKANLFQRFFSTKGTGGTGIGLMLTKKIVDLHQGQIDVVSDPGKGSLFRLRLP
ncbi:MAG: hybrid sensor histidine kinase/response regulator [Desulfobacterales bacterium]